MSGRGGGGKNADGVYIEADCRVEISLYVSYLYCPKKRFSSENITRAPKLIDKYASRTYHH